MATDYRARLKLPAEAIDQGSPDMPLLTRSGLLVAAGFTRIVIGGRGPYVEFTDEQIVPQAFHWVRTGAFYSEYRTNDVENVKAYYQHGRVDYADYRPGLWYVSPFDLAFEGGGTLIDPLPRRKRA
jgi:hypothetical protein